MTMEQRHILIADDEQLLCVTVADLLRDEGYKVSIVHDGSEVVPMIHKVPVDLILQDLMIPGMNGLEVLAQVKQQYPSTRVIIITGFGTDQYAKQAEALGTDGFVNKPFGVETLMRRIREVLASSSHRPFNEPPIG